MDGFEVCKEIRTFSNVPILFVSCKKDLANRIEGIEIGADDYITKPFDFHELEAELKLFSGVKSGAEMDADNVVTSMIRVDDILIDLLNAS